MRVTNLPDMTQTNTLVDALGDQSNQWVHFIDIPHNFNEGWQLC